MSVIIKPEYQIQRINVLQNQLQAYKSMEKSKLIKRPTPKSWSVVEVMVHMVIAQNSYLSKIEGSIAETSTKRTKVSELKASAIPAYLIKRFPPQAGKIKMKMKTSKKFNPLLELTNINDADVQTIFSDLEKALDQLKNWVQHYRTEAISLRKFNSAIGPIVRFNLPEACEFILCHNERHFLQMKNALTSE